MLHPLPSLATTAAAVAVGLVMGLASDLSRLTLMAITMLMIQFSISVLNDWADRGRDAVAGRAKPLVRGDVSPRLALSLAFLFAVGALPGAVAFGRTAGVVVLIGFLAGWAYDLWLSSTPLSFLPFAIAFPLLPIWVGLLAGRPLASLAWLILAGAPLAIGIHLGDSLPDIANDTTAGSRNLAVMLGPARSIGVIVGLLLIGALVVVIAVVSQAVLAVVVGVAALIAAWLVTNNRARPERVRWITGAYAIVATLALVTHLPHG
ncbi:MAG TPA: UbiA family prenyltransferase [Candidatus Dormibacteraeota bacterium]|nr:UbiA family prenyltransferase [Candidatus Dormibacteraeota bacterium]